MKNKESTFEGRFDAAVDYILAKDERSQDVERLLYAIRRKPQVHLDANVVVPRPAHVTTGRTNPTNASNLAVSTGDMKLIELLQLNEIGDGYEYDFKP